MKVSEIFDLLSKKYDLSLGESWDKNGLFYSHDNEVTGVYLALELTSKVLKEAKLLNANVIITHHPLFSSEDLTEEHQFWVNQKLIDQVEKSGIALIHLHTAFDKAKDGMNMQMAKMLELLNIKQDPNNLFVVTGETKIEVSLEYWCRYLKQKFMSPMITYTDNFKLKRTQKFAIVAGAGIEFADYVFANHDVDVFITADLKYHDWIDAIEKGYNVVDMHHASEFVFVNVLEKLLAKQFPKLELNKTLLSIDFKYF